jgi:uncharacterized protein (TIRG00374 family)
MNQTESTEWKVPWKGIVFGIAAGTLALILVFANVAHPKVILAELQNYPLRYFFGALACIMGAWAMDGVRMRSLTIGAGQPAPWWELVLVLIASNFITLVTPFAAGGGPYVVYALYRRGRSVPHATAVVAAGGFAAQSGLAVLASVVLAAVGAVPSEVAKYVIYVRVGFAAYLAIVVAVTVLAYQGQRVQQLVIRREVAETWMAEFQAVYRRLFQPRGRHFLRAFLASIAYFGLNYGAGYMILSGFGVSQGLRRYVLSVLLGVAPIISPIPGGAGAAEFVAYHMLDESLPLDALGTFIVLWRTVSLYIPVLVGGLLLSYQVVRYARLPRKQVD